MTSPDQEPTATRRIDYEALHAEALEHNFETLLERSKRETDPAFASDLRLTHNIAVALGDDGARALVVGGYARDSALARITGRPLASKDVDVEVYGLGFNELSERLSAFGRVDMVGASFGIAKVTNPDSGHILDFSIPRRDSKVDKGHAGFTVTGDPSMSVRDAARRRDLTINALALDPLTGELIDNFGGVDDLKHGVLRATDPELFGDDPLRALRVMQFAGRFEFNVDPATADICRSLDLTELPKERIGEEWVKLMTKSKRPSIGLAVAKDLGILEQLHPELDVLSTIDQEPDWHPEGNVWNHSMLAADAAAEVVRRSELSGDDALVVLFGALTHDLGKATTSQVRERHGVERITAHGHEGAGVEPAKAFMSQLGMKNSVSAMIVPIIREHLFHVHQPHPTDKQLHRFAERLKPANIRLWDLVSRCDSNARGGEFTEDTPSHAILEQSLTLKVSERAAEPIIYGRDLIQSLGLKAGVGLRGALDFLYDAQLGGEFTTVEEGLEYYRSHTEDAAVAVATYEVARERHYLEKKASRKQKKS